MSMNDEPKDQAASMDDALKRAAGEWSPECPHPNELLELAIQGIRYFRAPSLVAHIHSCDKCMGLYAQTRAVRRLAGRPDPVFETGSAAESPRAHTAQGEFSKPGTPVPRMRSIWPALGFAACGAAVAALALFVLYVPGLQSRSDRLQAELTAQRGLSAKRSADLSRLQKELEGAKAQLPSSVQPGIAFEDASALEAAVLSGRLTVPAALAGLTSFVRGGTSEEPVSIELRGPVGTFVLSDRPVLRAEPATGIREMKAVLTDVAGEEVLTKRLSPASWQPVPALRRGEAYQWSVEGMKGNEVALSPVASFGVLDAKAAVKAATQVKEYASRPLFLSVLCARAGLLDDADEALTRVLKAHPQHAIAKSLKRDLERIRKGGG